MPLSSHIQSHEIAEIWRFHSAFAASLNAILMERKQKSCDGEKEWAENDDGNEKVFVIFYLFRCSRGMSACSLWYCVSSGYLLKTFDVSIVPCFWFRSWRNLFCFSFCVVLCSFFLSQPLTFTCYLNEVSLKIKPFSMFPSRTLDKKTSTKLIKQKKENLGCLNKEGKVTLIDNRSSRKNTCVFKTLLMDI